MTSSLFGGGSSGGRPGGGSGSSGGRSTGYRVGFRPGFRLYVGGKQIVVRDVGRGATRSTLVHQAAISRVEVALGIDQIHTLTLTVVGDESAKFVQSVFEKRTEVALELGYDDYPASFARVFVGHALQAYPSGTNPVTVEVECDSLMYQARESRDTGDGTDPSQAQYIASRLAAMPVAMSANIDDVLKGEADEGGENDGELLTYIQDWSKANYVHWLDLMDSKVNFFYPGAKPQLFRAWRTWDLSVRKTRPGDTAPPVLSRWSPRIEFVEAPQTITAVWYDDSQVEIDPVTVTATNDYGLPDSVLHLGFLSVATQADAQAIVDKAAEDFFWESISGDFAITAGVPILPLDEITARNGPPGLEALYDRPMEVVKVVHVLDDSGWTVSGEIRGGR